MENRISRHLLTNFDENGLPVDGDETEQPSHSFIGLSLSVTSAVLVGGSFILQKKGLLRANRTCLTKDKHKGFGYLKQYMWWIGMLSMAVGEIINFVAYTIAPAILITPLGALRVIVSSVLSSIFLNESLDKFGKAGILLSLVGSTMIVIHSPRQEKVTTFLELVDQFLHPVFLVYCSILLIISLFLIFLIAPKRGHLDIMVYLTICNMTGALTVLCGKGLGISIKSLLTFVEPSAILLHPVFWVLITGQIAGIPLQVIYINKALSIFDTSAVTPIKYVFTNIFLIIGSLFLFQESLSPIDFLGFACGFASIVTGVVLLNSYKELQDTKVLHHKISANDTELAPSE